MATLHKRLLASVRAARDTWMKYGSDTSPSPLDALKWDPYEARVRRYQRDMRYYDNRIYLDSIMLSTIQQMRPPLYKHIRGIYNPVNRLVRVYVSKVYGGQLDMELLQDGAIPIYQADDRLRQAIKQAWIWSNWSKQKTLYVKYGSIFGDSAIKVVDDVDSQKVRMEVLDPRKIVEVRLDAVGNVKYIRIEYQKIDPDTGKEFTYGEEIDEDWFVTYRDDDEYAYFIDGSGNRVSRWRNEYGFVPVVLCQHITTDAVWGENPFHTALHKIDEVNDQASLLNDQVRKVINPLWAASGVGQGANLELDAGNRDVIPIIKAGDNVTFTPLVAPLDIANAGANIRDLLAELERDLPELLLARMLETGDVTATAIRASASAGISRIEEAQGNYDDALIRAQMMAVSIGGYRGYDGFAGYSLDSYARGDLAHFIGKRPVISDDLSKLEKVQTMQSISVSKRLLLRELGFSEDDIREEEMRDETRARSEVQSFTESVFAPDDDDDDELEEVEEDGTETASQKP
jgi:hypothetical protein